MSGTQLLFSCLSVLLRYAAYLISWAESQYFMTLLEILVSYDSKIVYLRISELGKGSRVNILVPIKTLKPRGRSITADDRSKANILGFIV